PPAPPVALPPQNSAPNAAPPPTLAPPLQSDAAPTSTASRLKSTTVASVATPINQEYSQPPSSPPVPVIIGSIAGVILLAISGILINRYTKATKQKRQEDEKEAQRIAALQEIELREREAAKKVIKIIDDDGVEEVYHPLGKQAQLYVSDLGTFAALNQVVIAAGGTSRRPRLISSDPNDWTIDDVGQWVAVNGGGVEGELVIHAQKINGRALLVLPIDEVLKSFKFEVLSDKRVLENSLLELRTNFGPLEEEKAPAVAADVLPVYYG
ncbi:hypothetical protein BDR26DRAFT_924705, partial [Obelidium mucronatum]